MVLLIEYPFKFPGRNLDSLITLIVARAVQWEGKFRARGVEGFVGAKMEK